MAADVRDCPSPREAAAAAASDVPAKIDGDRPGRVTAVSGIVYWHARRHPRRVRRAGRSRIFRDAGRFRVPTTDGHERKLVDFEMRRAIVCQRR